MTLALLFATLSFNGIKHAVSLQSDALFRGVPAIADNDTLYVWGDGGLVSVSEALNFHHSHENLTSYFDEDIENDEFLAKGAYTIVINKHKLAFCYIPKVACKEFNTMFNEVNGMKVSGETMFAGSAPKTFGINGNAMTKANGWTFAHFIRDPLKRYLSAFGSKCMPGPGATQISKVKGDNCEGETIDKPVTKHEAVRKFHERVFKDAKKGRLPDNPHWAPQTKLFASCDFEEIDYEEMLDGDVTSKVEKMLKMANVRMPTFYAEKYFPPPGKVGWQNRNPSTVTDNFDDFYNDPKVVQAVVDLYRVDYAKLPFSKP